jgi:hypothetical protein
MGRLCDIPAQSETDHADSSFPESKTAPGLIKSVYKQALPHAFKHTDMSPLTANNVRQGGGGRLDDIIGHVYVGSNLGQRGSNIGSFLGSVFRIVKAVLASGAGAVGRETLRPGANITSDMANKSSDTVVKRHYIKPCKRIDAESR